MDVLWPHYGIGMHQAVALLLVPDMGILPYKVLCNAALCVFRISLLKVVLSKVFDPDIEMKGKSGAGTWCEKYTF